MSWQEAVKQLKDELEATNLKLVDTEKELDKVKKKPPDTKFVYAPRERKLRKFAGDESTTEWIEEAKAGLALRKDCSPEEHLDFVVCHLEGAAKDEVRYRPEKERKTAGMVFAIIKEVFTEAASASEVLGQFHCRKQKEGESVMSFSLALMGLMDRAKKLHTHSIGDTDTSLRDHLADFVRDTRLKVHLKRLLREKPALTFLNVRQEAIAMEADSRGPQKMTTTSREVGVTVTEVPDAKASVASIAVDKQADLLKAIKSQGEMMARLIKDVERLKVDNNKPKFSGSGGYGPRSNLCWTCNSPEHYRLNCPLYQQQGGPQRSPRLQQQYGYQGGRREQQPYGSSGGPSQPQYAPQVGALTQPKERPNDNHLPQ